METSKHLRALCYHVGLLAVFDVFSSMDVAIRLLNNNEYDIVFVHEYLVLGPSGEQFLKNLRYLLSYIPIIIVGR